MEVSPFDEFIKDNYPEMVARYRMYKLWVTDRNKLIGKEVISIIRGFSGAKGTRMIVKDIVRKNQRTGEGAAVWGNDYIVLAPAPGYERLSRNGWLIDISSGTEEMVWDQIVLLNEKDYE